MKKVLAILLAAMMLLSLAACGNNDDNPSGSENNPGTSQSDNQGGEENKGGEENNGGAETYDWPTDEWIIDAMKYTGAGDIVSIERNDTENKKEIKLRIDGAIFADVASYYDQVVAGGMAVNYGEDKPDSDESFYPMLHDLENGYQVEFSYVKNGGTFNYGESSYNLRITLRKVES